MKRFASAVYWLGAAAAIATLGNLSRASETQPVTLRFAGKVAQQPFSCTQTYRLGKPATPVAAADFRFYVSDVSLIDASGKAVPVTLEQDGKWQYQTIALLDFENKTGACVNGTVETRDRVISTVPKGNYTGLKFTLGVSSNLNHEDATLAPSPLNLTGLWWNWQFGYKFARIDLQSPQMAGMDKQKHEGHGDPIGFPIHLGSTGCEGGPVSEKPTACRYPNRSTVTLTRFNAAKNTVVADLAQLTANTDLTQKQPNAVGCMSEPDNKGCISIMANLGLPFMKKPATSQTFFRVE